MKPAIEFVAPELIKAPPAPENPQCFYVTSHKYFGNLHRKIGCKHTTSNYHENTGI